MGPTSAGAIACATSVFVLAVSCMCFLWGRVSTWHRWPVRIGLIGLTNVAAVATVALVANSQFTFYASWSELFGHHPSTAVGLPSRGALDAALAPKIAAAHAAHHGLLTTIQIPALSASDVGTLSAIVYLPAAYGDRHYRDRAFPVIELLDGFPGSPQTWTQSLGIQARLDEMIGAGTMAPTVVVMPTSNVASPRDAECVDIPNGPQTDTYLSLDVRAAIERDFRVDHSGDAWGVGGYSTGGYCAMVMAARHPSMFAAAASLEGYNAALVDSTTGDLFAGDTALRNRADLLWWLHNPAATPVPLLAISSAQDDESYEDMTALIASARTSVWPVDALTLEQGGHNTMTFSAEVPTALAWLSRRIGAAATPVPTIDGVAPSRLPSRSG